MNTPFFLLAENEYLVYIYDEYPNWCIGGKTKKCPSLMNAGPMM